MRFPLRHTCTQLTLITRTHTVVYACIYVHIDISLFHYIMYVRMYYVQVILCNYCGCEGVKRWNPRVCVGPTLYPLKVWTSETGELLWVGM